MHVLAFSVNVLLQESLLKGGPAQPTAHNCASETDQTKNNHCGEPGDELPVLLHNDGPGSQS